MMRIPSLSFFSFYRESVPLLHGMVDVSKSSAPKIHTGISSFHLLISCGCWIRQGGSVVNTVL